MSRQHRHAKTRRREEKIQVFRAVWRFFVDRSLMLRRKYDPRNYTERHEAGSYRSLNTELLALAGGSDTQQFSTNPSRPRAVLY